MFLSVLPILLIAGIKRVYHHSRPLQKILKILLMKTDNVLLLYNVYNSIKPYKIGRNTKILLFMTTFSKETHKMYKASILYSDTWMDPLVECLIRM